VHTGSMAISSNRIAIAPAKVAPGPSTAKEREHARRR
jgi:hypothetical protein